MKLDLVGRDGLELTPAMKTYTEEKFKSLEKRFDHIERIHISFHLEKNQHGAEATFHWQGNEIHNQAFADDMYLAIDELIDKLLAQMTKLKEKIIDSHR